LTWGVSCLISAFLVPVALGDMATTASLGYSWSFTDSTLAFSAFLSYWSSIDFCCCSF